jgi:hypothetical protein
MTRSSSAWPREGIHAGPPINALGGVVVNDHIRCAPFALRGDDCCSFSLRSLRRGGGQVSTLRCGRQLLRSASCRACASLGRRTASVAGRSLGGASPRRRGRCRTMSRAMCGAPTGRGRTTAGSTERIRLPHEEVGLVGRACSGNRNHHESEVKCQRCGDVALPHGVFDQNGIPRAELATVTVRGYDLSPT